MVNLKYDQNENNLGCFESCIIAFPSSIFSLNFHLYDYWAKCISSSFVKSQTLYLNQSSENKTDKLISIIQEEKPSWVFVEPTFSLDINKIYLNKRRNGYRLCSLLFDSHYLYRSLYLPWTSISDLTVCENPLYSGMYRRYGINSHFLPYPFEHLDLEGRSFVREVWPISVSFVGNTTKQKPYRKFYLDFLVKNDLDVQVYGTGTANGYISYQEMTNVFTKSCVNLNFTQGTIGLGIQEDLVYERILNGRVFEIAAAGGLCLCEYSAAASAIWQDFQEIVYFYNERDLVEKIRYLIENPTIAGQIRNNAYQKFCAEFSKDVFLQRLKNLMLECKGLHLDLNLEVQQIIRTKEFTFESRKISFRTYLKNLVEVLGLNKILSYLKTVIRFFGTGQSRSKV